MASLHARRMCNAPNHLRPNPHGKQMLQSQQMLEDEQIQQMQGQRHRNGHYGHGHSTFRRALYTYTNLKLKNLLYHLKFIAY